MISSSIFQSVCSYGPTYLFSPAKKGDSGTLAARTRSIAKAAGLLEGDEEAGEYATRREKLREAAAMIASGKPPGVDLRAFVESADEALDSSGDATQKSGA